MLSAFPKLSESSLAVKHSNLQLSSTVKHQSIAIDQSKTIIDSRLDLRPLTASKQKLIVCPSCSRFCWPDRASHPFLFCLPGTAARAWIQKGLPSAGHIFCIHRCTGWQHLPVATALTSDLIDLIQLAKVAFARAAGTGHAMFTYQAKQQPKSVSED